MGSITSANVACGYHAGDPAVMRDTVRLARDAGVAVGAHPGLPDLAGFGRREHGGHPAEVEDLVALSDRRARGDRGGREVRLQHVKAHGALYNMAAQDRALADAIARAVARVRSDARPVRASRHRARARGRGRRAHGRARRLRRSRLRAGRFADAAVASGRGHPFHRTKSIGRAVRMVRDGVVRATNGSDIADARRHPLHPRRHARVARADPAAARRTRSGGRSRVRAPDEPAAPGA